MSNSHLFLKSGFVKTPLHNGVGRYVCQLQRVVLKFCKEHGSSRGMRDFVQNKLVEFAKENPEVVVYLKPRRHRTAVISAEYLNGDKQLVSCRNFTEEEITKWLGVLRTQAGDTSSMRLRKMWHTENPSIQGPWTPYTFRDPALNLAKFPSKELSEPLNQPKSATEQLLEMFKNQQKNVKELESKRAE